MARNGPVGQIFGNDFVASVALFCGADTATYFEGVERHSYFALTDLLSMLLLLRDTILCSLSRPSRFRAPSLGSSPSGWSEEHMAFHVYARRCESAIFGAVEHLA